MRKTFILLTFVFAVVFTSCTSLQNDANYTVNPSILVYGLQVGYSGAEYLTEQANKRAVVELREKTNLDFSNLGYVNIYVQGTSIRNANPKLFTYVLKDSNGNVLFRGSGTDKIPSYSKNNNIWYAFDTIEVKEDDISFPLYLRIITPKTYGREYVDFTIKKKR